MIFEVANITKMFRDSGNNHLKCYKCIKIDKLPPPILIGIIVVFLKFACSKQVKLYANQTATAVDV